MPKEPVLPEKDVAALAEMIDWVKRARNDSERFERVLGMKAFVDAHPRLRDAAEVFRKERLASR